MCQLFTERHAHAIELLATAALEAAAASRRSGRFRAPMLSAKATKAPSSSTCSSVPDSSSSAIMAAPTRASHAQGRAEAVACDQVKAISDAAASVPHAALRAYVMGERGANPDEVPTVDELTAMAAQVRAGIEAGALGFTTSRTYIHRTRDGAPLGTRFAPLDELTALGTAMAETGRGVFQLISDAYQSHDTDYVEGSSAR